MKDVMRDELGAPKIVDRSIFQQVELSDVTALELIIVPNNSSGAARASLKNLRLS